MAAPGDRFARAVQLRGKLQERGIYFAPIRHHSPACATAVKKLITEVSPAAVLIEGPAEYDQMLPALTHPQTAPPVAILSVSTTTEQPVSSFFPLADFSPEWIAIKEAAAAKIPIAFIDESWDVRTKRNADNDHAQSLQTERYYAESRTLADLAQKEHCRDHDELWEHLFELRETSWQQLFAEVFAWSALARLDYEPEVLIAEGSLAREAVMTQHIAHWHETSAGPLIVVTGAFHTLALVEAMAALLQLSDSEGAGLVLGQRVKDVPNTTENSWLIRYDLTRLDAYSGYGAGIRSPGFYQRFWDASADREHQVTNFLVDIARIANQANTSDLISTAEVLEASLQAERLATLRAHPIPGRTDLLDACTSVFVHGEVPLPPAIRDAIAEVFGGSRLGVLPPGVAAPPIVAEARNLAKKLHFNVSDSAHRKTTLDTRNSANARVRSRFLALMSYLDTGFARKLAGPDYIASRSLGRIREEWDYAWTPMVEARLISLISEGATLVEVARRRIRASEDELGSSQQQRSCQAVTQLVAQVALIGLDDELTRLMTRLDQMIEKDPSLASVLQATSQLLGLWRARDLLDLAEPAQLVELITRALPQLAYLIAEAATCKREDEAGVVRALVGVKELARDLSETLEIETIVIREALSRLRLQPEVSPGILGAATALGAVEGSVDDAEFSKRIQATFAPGSDPDFAMRFLAGLMQAAPDLLLYTAELFEAVDQVVSALEPIAFLALLPDLRRSFSWLKPLESAKLAGRIAERTGIAAANISATTQITEAELRIGLQIEQQLRKILARDGLLELTP